MKFWNYIPLVAFFRCYLLLLILTNISSLSFSNFSFTLNSERLVGMTLCPARGNHFGSALYQQLMKSLSDGFISECMGTTLKRMPCLPRSPRWIVLSIPKTMRIFRVVGTSYAIKHVSWPFDAVTNSMMFKVALVTTFTSHLSINHH